MAPQNMITNEGYLEGRYHSVVLDTTKRMENHDERSLRYGHKPRLYI